MKKTKIICTIGPACDTKEDIEKLVNAGMNVARINLSHGNQQSHQKTINNLKAVQKTTKNAFAIMLDTKGPEIRIKNFKNGFASLESNKTFTLTTNEVKGTNTIVSLAYKNLINDIKIGNLIYANNGNIVLKVKDITKTDIICKIIYGGILTNGKGLNIPNIPIRETYLSEKDKQDLLFAIKNNVEFIAASFVSKKEDVLSLKKFLKENGGETIKIIAKIENASGVANFEQIVEICDGLMIARGDLGVEIPLEKIPPFQKRAIEHCNNVGKISIVATEMLESMTSNFRPTRAEVSDVANAIYEKTTATMLSGETAVGKNPERVVKTMNKIIVEAEKNIEYNKDFSNKKTKPLSMVDSVSQSTCLNAVNTKAKAIFVFTNSGQTACFISRHKTSVPIIALTRNEKIQKQLSLCWNTVCVLQKKALSQKQMIEFSIDYALKNKLAKKGQHIIVQTGNYSGPSNTSQVITV